MDKVQIRCLGDAAVVLSHTAQKLELLAIFGGSCWFCEYDQTENPINSFEELRLALDDVSDRHEPFSIHLEGDKVIVTWTHSLSDGINLVKGKFSLDRMGPMESGVLNILAKCKGCITSQSEIITALKAENLKLEAIAKDSVQKFAKFVEETNEKEARLYSTFATILNEKKEKIRQLQKNIVPFEMSPPSLSISTDAKCADENSASKINTDLTPKLETKRLAEKLAKSPLKTESKRISKSEHSEMDFDDLF